MMCWRNGVVGMVGSAVVMAGMGSGRVVQAEAPDRLTLSLQRNFVAEAVKVALPAVVNVRTKTMLFEGMAPIGIGSGSGFIIDPKGIMVTNNHVIAHADQIKVGLNDGRELEAKVVGADEPNDIAILQLQPSFRDEKFPAIQMGSSENLLPGEFVVAVGSPLSLQGTVTFGIVSSPGRKFSEITNGLRGSPYPSFIQVDCPINQGNSGGPLLNLDGEVIGINTFKAGSSHGIGFAIPISDAKQVISQIIEKGFFEPRSAGVNVVKLGPEVEKWYRHYFDPQWKRPETSHGVLVASIVPGAPAARAGVLPGDVITHVEHLPIKDVDQLQRALRNSSDSLKLTILRAQQKLEIPLKFSKRR